MPVNGIDANYYTVVDLGKMNEFYSRLLGQPGTRAERWSEWTLADGSTFGIYNAGGKPAGRSGSVMFAVDDVEAMGKRAREAGAEVEDEVTDTPMCRMMFGADPEGNQFILHKRKN